jgi:ATP/maltotriose-dependent transcriptional regulator MalT
MAMGEVEEARECFDQAIAIASEIDDRLLVANAKLQLSLISLDQGELEQARELVGQAYSEFKLTRNWRGSAIAMRVRARLFRAEGDVERARSNLRRAANLAEEMSDPWLQAQVNLGGAELEEEVGRLDVAAENAAAAASMARDLSDVLLVARAERVLGRVRYRQGRRREALTLLANSVETLRRCGAQVDAGRAALDFAIAAHGMPSGTRQTGDDMLRYALTTFEQTGATRDLGIAQAIAQRLRSRQAFVGSER